MQHPHMCRQENVRKVFTRLLFSFFFSYSQISRLLRFNLERKQTKVRLRFGFGSSLDVTKMHESCNISGANFKVKNEAVVRRWQVEKQGLIMRATGGILGATGCLKPATSGLQEKVAMGQAGQIPHRWIMRAG